MAELFAGEAEQIRRRLERARAPAEPELEALTQDLEIVLEELRVTEDEVHAQELELRRLSEDQELARGRDEHLLSALPVPALTTDRHGRLRGVNPAAGALFAGPIPRLLRKPLFAYVDDRSLAAARTCLSEVLRTRSPRRLSLDLAVRGGRVPVTAYVAPAPRSDDEVSWLLLPGTDEAPDSSTRRAGVLDRVLTILALAGHEADSRSLVQRLADAVAGALGPEVAVTVSVGSPLEATVVASTSSEAQVVDRWQLEAGGGPSPLSLDSQAAVVTSSLRDDPRWGLLGDPGEISPFEAAVAVPLTPTDGPGGVLTAYLPPTSPPTADLVEDVELLGGAVSSVLQELELRSHITRLQQDMRDALASRAEIEQAKGIVMAGRRCSADEAFQQLVVLSNTTHRKLREVAHDVVRQAGG